MNLGTQEDRTATALELRTLAAQVAEVGGEPDGDGWRTTGGAAPLPQLFRAAADALDGTQDIPIAAVISELAHESADRWAMLAQAGPLALESAERRLRADARARIGAALADGARYFRAQGGRGFWIADRTDGLTDTAICEIAARLMAGETVEASGPDGEHVNL